MLKANSTFKIDSWKAEPWDEAEGAKLGRARLTKTFQGEIEGTSVAEILTAITDVPAVYVGLERLTIALHGVSGTFVLHHNAAISPDGVSNASWSIIPNTGTGGLRGISGHGTIARHDDGSHTFVLEYRLPEPHAWLQLSRLPKISAS